MMVGRLLGTVAALLAAASLGASAAEGARPLKIGVVDVDKMLREYKKSDDLYKKISEDYKPLEDALKKKLDMIVADRRKLEDSGRDGKSVEFLRDKQALELRIAELQTEERKFLTERNAAELKAMNDVWDDLTAFVAKLAKDKGLDLVIKQQLRPTDAKSKDSFYRNVSGCTVLYHTDQLDLTDELLKAMNAEYERGGDKAPAPEPKTPAPTPKGGKRG